MDHGFGVFALGGTTGAKKVFVFDDPKLFAIIKAELLARLYVGGGEEANAGKAKILVIHEHLTAEEGLIG